MTTILTFRARTPLATSLNPITRRLRARAFLSSRERICRRINSPSMSTRRGMADSSSMREEYGRGFPRLGTLGTRLHSAYRSGMILSPENMGGGGAGEGADASASAAGLGSDGVSATETGSFSGPLPRSSALEDLTMPGAESEGAWSASLAVARMGSPPRTVLSRALAAALAASAPPSNSMNILPFSSPLISALKLATSPYLLTSSRTSSIVSSRHSSSSKSSSVRTFSRITTPGPASAPCCCASSTGTSSLARMTSPPKTVPLSPSAAATAISLPATYVTKTLPLLSPSSPSSSVVSTRTSDTSPYSSASARMSSRDSSRHSSSSRSSSVRTSARTTVARAAFASSSAPFPASTSSPPWVPAKSSAVAPRATMGVPPITDPCRWSTASATASGEA
mmetsp:Transcript_54559/g.163013  ORF Transcript_54559/g.163013 Transcript_54559/m.163013 type:complete len:396 (+) Transcript_54559:430-1617(+)